MQTPLTDILSIQGGVSVIIGLIVFLLVRLKVREFVRFLGILAIGILASFIPVGLLSVIMGFPAVFISAVAVTILYKYK